MNTPASASQSVTWQEMNQRSLRAALDGILSALDQHIARAELHDVVEHGESLLSSPHMAISLHRASPTPLSASEAPALDYLSAAFHLTPFERDLLLLCAGVELDDNCAKRCGAAQGDSRRAYATFSLGLAALPGAHWSALTPAAPLRRWRLVDMRPGEALTTCPLRIDERILHYLLGVSYLDERLRGLVHPATSSGDLPPSHGALARRIAGLWAPADVGAPSSLIQLCGGEVLERRDIAASACAVLDLPLSTMNAANIPATVAEREALIDLWERELILSGGALLLECDDLDTQEARRSVLSFVERVGGLLALSGRDLLPVLARPCVRLDVPRPDTAERLALWRVALGPTTDRLDGQLEALAAQFGLSGVGARAAIAAAHTSTHDDGENGDNQASVLWEASRAQARARLDDLAQRLVSSVTWDDLVLPDAQRQVVHAMVAHARQRSLVYERWGFAAKSARGLGISALFAGPSGTGKTLAAEALANELHLDLYHIDLSAVVSKYIGETEKNLRRLFDAADAGGAVLLFDEADALFGKRSEVRDSHDRYANIEVSYLLQRMEAYRGLAILTTNMKEALDSAFLRRIRFTVHFPFPGPEQRAEIWRRVFPIATPTDALDIERLARLNITGGSIRNIALNAAFLAANAGQPVTMDHLLQAAYAEYTKLERPLTGAEIGGWR
ncbi:MAG TPA: ATP-binding protein [Ktedonobacterales bacterium]|nr:ATP-binding protein [Ktedonobacterales bacterium]